MTLVKWYVCEGCWGRGGGHILLSPIWGVEKNLVRLGGGGVVKN